LVDDPLRERRGFSWADGFAIAYGVVVTLVLGYYQFGLSNHTVYLLDGLHKMNRSTLANDWFTTETFQYHALFGLLTRLLWSNIQTAFLLGYLGLVVLLHTAWFLLTRRAGGGRFAYMLSVLFVYASGGGAALGAYGFLQDSAFLPSNISSVALLWGILLWLLNRPMAAAVGFGIAAAFHLNYAVVAPVIWLAILFWDAWDTLRGRLEPVHDPVVFQSLNWTKIFSTLVALVPAGVSILLALRAMPQTGAKLPLQEFLDLYVHLRHPHHYDPLSWPKAMWIACAWPILPAMWAAWRATQVGRAVGVVPITWLRGTRLTILFLAILGAAFYFAGWTFIDERLVQMSLFRFSIYPQLFLCIAVAIWISHVRPLWALSRPLVALALPAGLIYATLRFTDGQRFLIDDPFFQTLNARPMVIACGLSLIPFLTILVDRYIYRRQQVYGAALLALGSLTLFGWSPENYGLLIPRPDAGMNAVTAWARKRTPPDAVFLVPPDEETFRLAARRAIVVNFKGVPQLSTELPQWRDRLESVLDLDDLRTLSTPMPATLREIRRIYNDLPPEYLRATAEKWGARYIVTTRSFDEALGGKPVFTAPGDAYFVYDLSPRE
jgi:hypothetical protein